MSQRGNGEKAQGMVAVAIDKDKGSQAALKWAVDNLLGKGKSVTFLHVKQKTPGSFTSDLDGVAKELFLPFRCFCTRKEIQVTEVVLEDTDVARAICDFVKSNLIENLVVGSSSQNGKFKSGDIPVSISKCAPDFCNVYAINKGKVASLRSAVSPLPTEFQYSKKSLSKSCMEQGNGTRGATMSPFAVAAKANTGEDLDSIKSPFTRNRVQQSKGELSSSDIDVSFISSGRSSCDHNSSPSDLETFMMPPRLSSSSDSESRTSSGSQFSNLLMSDPNYGMGVYSSSSLDGGRLSWSGSQAMDDAEGEIRRLKQELKQMMDMYSNACKEALTAKRKATELQRWKTEEQQRLEEAQLAKEAALATVEKEKQKCRAAIERAEAAERRAELEVQKRKQAEKKALQESEENRRLLNQFRHKDVRYRKYSIQELEAATNRFDESLKIGEGGYGPVFKCYLDHTPVAVKILHPDAAQGKSQFQQEVEVLSCIRHPNMVLLLGACPENGCLVYEYMANGSLDDRLFRRGNTPVLSWQLRFRIAAEIATGLLFLHQSKPEPLVHRDLKPANILLDYNFVSKISDVGLARLVPPSVADCVTQYHMTSAAGTFCYIDPEYQQTGMLGIKSDVYSLGVMLLQIITAKSPMGLTHHVERSIEKGTFTSMLDPEVTDWPVEEALQFARMALRCTELRRKDRPDLGTEVLPLLERLRGLAVAEGSISPCYVAKPESKYLDYSSNDSLSGVN